MIKISINLLLKVSTLEFIFKKYLIFKYYIFTMHLIFIKVSIKNIFIDISEHLQYTLPQYKKYLFIFFYYYYFYYSFIHSYKSIKILFSSTQTNNLDFFWNSWNFCRLLINYCDCIFICMFCALYC